MMMRRRRGRGGGGDGEGVAGLSCLASTTRSPAAVGRSKCSKCFHETFKGSCTKLFVTKIGILEQMTPPLSP